MATAASEEKGDEEPLVDAPSPGGRALGAKAAVAALAALAALAPAAALAVGAVRGVPGRPAPQEALRAFRDALRGGLRERAAAWRGLRAGAAAAAPCEDTPNWTNGYWECGGNVHAGPNCRGRGLTCEAYAASGWCQRGGVTPGFEKAFGQGMAWPELNCCACGGGSSLRSGAGVENLTDVDARRGCVDTPGWTDGNWECNAWKSKPLGCTPRGLTCGAYQAGELCLDGAPAPGREFVVGKEYLFPEKNCCVCGGGYNTSGESGAPAAAA